MLRKVNTFCVTLILISTSIIILIEIAPIVQAPTTLYVGGSGGGNYSKIQWAIDNASDGDTVFVYNGTYYENVLVNKTISLIGENMGNTVIDGGGNEDVIKITADWVNITGFTVMKTGKGSGRAGIELTDVLSCRIYGNNITNNRDGIYLSSSNHNIINNNHFFANNLSGIFVSYSVKNSINNNNFFPDKRDVIYKGVSINLFYSNETTISDNVMMEEGIFIKGDLLGHWNTHNIDISNTLNGKPLYYWKNLTGGIVPLGAGQIILANCSNIKITNQAFINGSVGVSLGFSSQNNISNTCVINNHRGIYLWDSDRNNISNNNISETVWGIMSYLSSANNITLNLVSNSDVGIYLLSCNGNNITNNTALSNYEGISLYNSNENDIFGNFIFKNMQFGISVSESDYNNITSNILTQNYYGIYFYYCGWNKVIGNTIALSSWYGVKLTYVLNAWDNIFYHNNFISNVYQAYDNDYQFRNKWDNGYPSGGNYWSDYTGVDLYNGPNQDINGSDGIGDSFRGIATNSLDQYPLMVPFPGKCLFLKPGWNLISIPLIQKNQELEKVLEIIEGQYDAVQWYNITDIDNPWKHHKVGKPFGNDLNQLNESMGFWVHITYPGDTIFVYNGTQSTINQTISLTPGWNLVGYPSLTNKNRTDALNNIDFGLDVDAIWTYNATTQTWKEITASDNFEVGRGYWMHSKVTKTWIVPL